MDFSLSLPNNIPDELCDDIVARFEKDPHQGDGVCGGGAVRKDVKSSTDVCINPRLEAWTDVLEQLEAALRHGVDQYKAYLKTLHPTLPSLLPAQTELRGYTTMNIQRSVPGQGFTWHQDGLVQNRAERKITFLWYLNSLPDAEADGGGTDFVYKSVQPCKGTLVLFPANWTAIHRGIPVKRGVKYIATGWLSALGGQFYTY